MTASDAAWGFVFARGGSTGVPRKNLAEIGGVPLVARAIDSGRRSGVLDRIIVSTDDAEIATVARTHGAEVPWLRPPELATSDSPELLAWKHAVEHTRLPDGSWPYEVFVSIPATAPLRRPEDIERCVHRFREGDVEMVVAVVRSRVHPSYNLFAKDSQGSLHLLSPPNVPITRRQDLPPAFEIRPVAYVASPQHIAKAPHVIDGKVAGVEVSELSALDIDTPLDLDIARLLDGYTTRDDLPGL